MHAFAHHRATATVEDTRFGRTNFVARNVLSLSDYTREDLSALFEATDGVLQNKQALARERPLAGHMLASAFFDSSTRTRLAHECAMQRLGGAVTGFGSSAGLRTDYPTCESMSDTLRMLSYYSDVTVVRTGETGYIDHAAVDGTSAGTPLINGGCGLDEHPTQAFVDMFTIRQAQDGTLEGLDILIVNDLRMRCVRSLLRGLRRYDVTVHVLRADQDSTPLPRDLATECLVSGPRIVEHEDVRGALRHADIIYCSPSVWVRGIDPDDRAVSPVVSRDVLAQFAKPNARVLHPLPRGPELPEELDHTQWNGYWLQAELGVPLRMSLLLLLLLNTPPDALRE